MEKYVIGTSLTGIEELPLLGDKVNEISGDIVIVVLDKNANGHLYEYYSKIRQLILNRNRIILICVGDEANIQKQICMLLLSYNLYDIYKTDNKERITAEYIYELINRNPSQEEVRTFIGSDITAYAAINDVLIKITDKVKTGNVEELRELLEDNLDIIENSVDVLDYMKTIIDTVNTGEHEGQIQRLNDRVKQLEMQAETERQQKVQAENRLKNEIEGKQLIERDRFRATQKIQELEQQLNSREPIIKTYSEVQTQMLRCKVKVILYFKEVTFINYMPSFINCMVETMEKLAKLKVKLMIYDNKNSFVGVYKPLPIIGSNEYLGNRDMIINKYSKIVVVEANQALIEETLTSDWDVVIIYDRLRQANDIVKGNNVYKYWIINSISEFNALNQTFKIEKENVITNPGVFPESIAITEIPNHKTKTPSAKLADYVQMINLGSKKSKIYDIIFQRTNIDKISKRS